MDADRWFVPHSKYYRRRRHFRSSLTIRKFQRRPTLVVANGRAKDVGAAETEGTHPSQLRAFGCPVGQGIGPKGIEKDRSPVSMCGSSPLKCRWGGISIVHRQPAQIPKPRYSRWPRIHLRQNRTGSRHHGRLGICRNSLKMGIGTVALGGENAYVQCVEELCDSFPFVSQILLEEPRKNHKPLILDSLPCRTLTSFFRQFNEKCSNDRLLHTSVILS
uniref:Uncharacterized protein n=1 Tax=Candidatus Kentrum sp. LFY TaxID=2126342 RepID=A0A450US71_9GAMM|nr:MAG: hypothetical protein BECKLFY1418A_GA0070994_104913 [Candidatus Kentron sp. LFY]